MDPWFTDGSGINHCFGAEIYGPKDDYRESISMGSHSTVFSAEILAILRCTEHLTKNTIGRKINICSDSGAAILALAKTTTESYLVWDCMLALEKLSRANKVILVWVPGHQ
ncbi:lian-aa1 retrotransposon protein, partial [Lasius niger]